MTAIRVLIEMANRVIRASAAKRSESRRGAVRLTIVSPGGAAGPVERHAALSPLPTHDCSGRVESERHSNAKRPRPWKCVASVKRFLNTKSFLDTGPRVSGRL
jgi:hypothetical protein